MSYKVKIVVLIFSIYIISIGCASAEREYTDNFNNFDLSVWTKILGNWQITNGSIVGTGYLDILFNEWSGTKYISEIDLTADNFGSNLFSQIGFYFYFRKESGNYGMIYIKDGDYDGFDLFPKGNMKFSYTKSYINTSDNSTITLNPNQIHHLKVVRLDKNIYVYFDDILALTTEFKDENPEGKVGFNIFDSKGYFDNFYLRPITMKNASGYINELNLTSTNPTTRLGAYTLSLEGIDAGSVMFSLSKFGKKVDTTMAGEGTIATLNFENGDAGVEFKLAKIFSGGSMDRVILEDIITASSDSINVGVTNIKILPSYYQGENMSVTFSVTNPGNILYNGNPTITLNSEGGTATMSPELALSAGQSKEFSAVLVAPKTMGPHLLTITLKSDEYTTVSKTQDYQVHTLNPVVTTLSPDIREENGIRGSVTLDSAFPDELVNWNMTSKVEVFRVLENGKQRVYSSLIPVKSNKFDIAISYPDFYSDDGRYLVTLTAGEMMSDKFFEIKGPDGEYKPVKGEMIPQTIVSNALYPQLMMLLIGMVAALSVRNYMHPKNWSLPLDLVVVGCGAAIFAAGMIRGETEILIKSMIIAGVGFMLLIAREHDTRVDSLFLRGSSIHDFIGLVLIFFSTSYIMMSIPEWNLPLIVGTLIVYYTVINLHGERTK